MLLGLILSALTPFALALPLESHMIGRIEDGSASFEVSPEIRGISSVSLKKFSLQIAFQLKNKDGDVLVYSKHPLGKKKSDFKLFSGSKSLRGQIQRSKQRFDILDSQEKRVGYLAPVEDSGIYEFTKLDGELLTRLIRLPGDRPTWKLEIYEDDELSPELALAFAAYESRFEIQDIDKVFGIPIPSKRP